MSSVLTKPYHNILCPQLDATCGQAPIHPILARSSSVTEACARYAQVGTAEDGISNGIRSNMDASPHLVEVVNSWLTHALIWGVIAATRALGVPLAGFGHPNRFRAPIILALYFQSVPA